MIETMKRIHFIGIGGIGVSALARHFLASGASVSGSDLAASEITAELAREGARVIVGAQSAFNIPSDTDLVVHTAAVPKANPEFKEAKRRKIPMQTYAQAVGDLTRRFKTITISGSHGKSTTTAMTALVLEEGHRDPTVVIGTKMKEFGGANFRYGRGGYLVLEADEWNRSFFQYSPFVAAITNIDAEHLDTYKTAAGVERAFRRFLDGVAPDGAIVANADDEGSFRVAKRFGKKVLLFSRRDPDAAAVAKILCVPGEHNLSNALAARAIGRALGIREPDILSALARFRGTWRRFEWKGMLYPQRSGDRVMEAPGGASLPRALNGALVFSDYGHHPTEIAATLAAARERFPYRRLVLVYQPHQHQRLQYLWDDFVGAFDLADRILLLPVYDVAGRETAQAKSAVSSEHLAAALGERGKDIRYVPTFDEAGERLRGEARPGDILLLMGAGDIYMLTENLVSDSITA